MLNVFICSWTTARVAGLPRVKQEWWKGVPLTKNWLVFLSFFIFLLIIMDLFSGRASSISISAPSLPCWTKSLTAVARPRTLGEYPNPKQIAQTIVDFPDPLGPMTRFIFGPGKNSAEVYVTKFVSVTRSMEPAANLSFNTDNLNWGEYFPASVLLRLACWSSSCVPFSSSWTFDPSRSRGILTGLSMETCLL